MSLPLPRTGRPFWAGSKGVWPVHTDGGDAELLLVPRVKAWLLRSWLAGALLLCAGAATPSAHSEMPPPGTVFRDCPACPEMVAIPPGSFIMGSPAGEKGRESNEGPQHRVTIARPFALGKYEVTFAEWAACVADRGCRRKDEGEDEALVQARLPVFAITWRDAKGYVAWLSRRTGKTYRLPSEAEWEYAARAGSTSRYSWGDEVGSNNAACRGCGSSWDDKGAAPVGSFAANAFGLHDMHGNRWEWTEDCAQDDYVGAPVDGRAWTKWSCSIRVLRGGSYGETPEDLRSARRRQRDETAYRGYTHYGFRVARTF